ncbi:MAG TPA: 1-deoxy-D-xylulose-5-phosphate synthase [Clostridia bacterium]
MSILDTINAPEDLKSLSIAQLKQLSEEIRKYLIDTISITGGHLASNLGVVELTLALYQVFNPPIDKFIWDVGHQSYIHKILTGRKERLTSIRSLDGISGFPNIEESEYDIFNTGHASTSISAGLGMARARDLKGEDYNIISIIGDGALTGGMAFEALNDLGVSRTKMIIILNDNNMSISPNIGGVNNYLSKIRVSKKYAALKLKIFKIIDQLPLVGKPLKLSLEIIRDNLKFALINGKMFEQFGLKYIGPIDGHNLEELIEFLTHVKNINEPVLLHVVTQKGKGLPCAEKNPTEYHGLNSPNNNGNGHSFSKALGKTLSRLADEDKSVVAITAAMAEGTGLDIFKNKHKDRFFDVAICEAHAVTMAAGLAASGLKPYAAIYSTFLQRSFDQILHDVCLMRLPVRFCIDRAGVVGADGVTHQGIYDLSYLSLMPDMTITAPKDIKEFEMLLEWSLNFNAPLAIRYPKDSVLETDIHTPIEYGKWEVIKSYQSNIYVIAAGGRMIKLALDAEKLINKTKINIINARFIKPLDSEFLDNLPENSYVITMEDNVLHGGLGQAVSSYLLGKNKSIKIKNIAMPDKVAIIGSIEEVYEKLGLTPEKISQDISEFIN